MTLLVIGGSGLVGSNIVDKATGEDFEVYATYQSEETEQTDVQLDKTDVEATHSLVREIDPDYIVDTAAFHAVDDCETKRATAWEVNAAGTRNVAVAANEVDAHYVYLSTDYVFPGNSKETPYTEADSVAPLNYYAQTKYAGEQAARIADTATVLRPSVIYGVASGNFLTWALGELAAGNEIDIVDDQVSCPTYAPDLARASMEIFRRETTGLYHATGPESVSRYDFTIKLAETCGYDSELVSPITTEEFGQEAPRPSDSSLDSTRLYDAIEYEFRGLESSFTQIADDWSE
jgi:dTDP-4-dehydrorhamnose reductase